MVCPDPRMSEESRLAWQIHSWDVFHGFWLTTSSSPSPPPMRIHLPSHPAPSLLVDGTRQRGCGREALGRPLPGYCGGSESGPGAASPGRKSPIAGDPRWDREATHSCFSPELPESGRRTPGAVPRQHPVPTHPASAPLGGLRSCHVISTKRGGP